MRDESRNFDRQKIISVLDEAFTKNHQRAMQDSEENKIFITTENDEGKERTFSIDSQGAALVYQLNGKIFTDENGSQQTIPPIGRPSTNAWLRYCAEILSDLGGPEINLGIDADVSIPSYDNAAYFPQKNISQINKFNEKGYYEE